MPGKVTEPNKKVTDSVLLKHLAKQGIDSEYVEFTQDYAIPSIVNGKREKGKSPYAKFYKDRVSGKGFMVVSGLPMVNADGKKVEIGWIKEGKKYISKPNQFYAEVEGSTVTIRVINDQPSGAKKGDEFVRTPQLFLNGREITCGLPILLPVDPINANYLENTLEWDYGICKRRLRLIEGSIFDRFVFDTKPNGDIQTGVYSYPNSSFDTATYPVQVKEGA